MTRYLESAIAFCDRNGETIAALGFLLLIPAIIALASMAEIILLPEETAIIRMTNP